ncbi:hypothetical protein BRYFOR_06696 [Marvinbryantia formatexigens DSM 14469]|uniref:Uncharacterized protein n=1 Tax=Marvinbryantia formatexigens DSM 14469 TaxID=478749 RepID=C6LD38_9FIRM|nr:hypothetical protein BRYFOR_06696 [Marvinbryantia formatexigens DSM 14469]
MTEQRRAQDAGVKKSTKKPLSPAKCRAPCFADVAQLSDRQWQL